MPPIPCGLNAALPTMVAPGTGSRPGIRVLFHGTYAEMLHLIIPEGQGHVSGVAAFTPHQKNNAAVCILLFQRLQRQRPQCLVRDDFHLVGLVGHFERRFL